MDRQSRKAYLYIFNNKKSLPARISDGVSAAVITYIVISLVLLEIRVPRAANVVCSLLLSAAVVTGYRLLRDLRFERFVKRQREETKKNICKDKLLLCSENDFYKAACDCAGKCGNVYAYQHKMPMDADALLCIYRKATAAGEKSFSLVSLYGFDDEARAQIKKLDAQITLYDGDDMLKAAVIDECTDDDADAAFAAAANEQKKPRLKERFGKGSAKAYLFCGIMLFVMSLFVRFTLYFRLVGTICLWMAVFRKASGNGSLLK